MVNLINLLATAPGSLWAKIIFAFNGAVKNYALAIIILTILIKLVMLPLDYLNRRSSAKMSEMQKAIQPEMQAIQKKYPDKQVQNQKMGELYKKRGYNPLGSCGIVLLATALSMVIFFTLFGSLNSMASYKITNQYEQLQVAYVSDYVVNEKGETIDSLTQEKIDLYIQEILTKDEITIGVAQTAVADKYKEVQDSFLWIKNVWIADSPTKKAIPTYEGYAKIAGIKADERTEEAKNIYIAVMGDLEAKQGVNGFFLLSILAGVSAFLSQYLLTKKKKDSTETKKAKVVGPDGREIVDTQEQTNKVMLILLPVIMLVFTLSYNSVFAIYIVASQLVSVATAPLINMLINKNKNNSPKNQIKGR